MSINKHTSEQIASFASEIERMEQPLFMTADLWKKIKAIAGSALTQAPEKNEADLITGYQRTLLKRYVSRKYDTTKALKEMLEQK